MPAESLARQILRDQLVEGELEPGAVLADRGGQHVHPRIDATREERECVGGRAE